jgi:hypothetical protein
MKARIETDPSLTRQGLQDRAVFMIRHTNDVTEYFIVILPGYKNVSFILPRTFQTILSAA